MSNEQYEAIENIIGYKFNDKKNLDIAFTHKSFANEIMCGKRQSYERFEFLGDAILEFVVSDYLFNEYKDKDEGSSQKQEQALSANLPCHALPESFISGNTDCSARGKRTREAETGIPYYVISLNRLLAQFM